MDACVEFYVLEFEYYIYDPTYANESELNYQFELFLIFVMNIISIIYIWISSTRKKKINLLRLLKNMSFLLNTTIIIWYFCFLSL